MSKPQYFKLGRACRHAFAAGVTGHRWFKTARAERRALPPSSILPSVVAGILAVLMICSATGCRTSPDNHPPEAATTTKSGELAAGHQALTGAELYAINCNRCHPERSPVEWNAREWETILTHMRVRANLPAAQARVILEYLQTNSGN